MNTFYSENIKAYESAEYVNDAVCCAKLVEMDLIKSFTMNLCLGLEELFEYF